MATDVRELLASLAKERDRLYEKYGEGFKDRVGEQKSRILREEQERAAKPIPEKPTPEYTSPALEAAYKAGRIKRTGLGETTMLTSPEGQDRVPTRGMLTSARKSFAETLKSRFPSGDSKGEFTPPSWDKHSDLVKGGASLGLTPERMSDFLQRERGKPQGKESKYGGTQLAARQASRLEKAREQAAARRKRNEDVAGRLGKTQVASFDPKTGARKLGGKFRTPPSYEEQREGQRKRHEETIRQQNAAKLLAASTREASRKLQQQKARDKKDK